MELISYAVFLAEAQENDVRTLSLLASGERIGTTNAAEADAFFAQCQRLYDAGLLERVNRGYEDKDGVLWQTFDGRVRPEAMVYVAQCAMERLILSRAPIPPV